MKKFFFILIFSLFAVGVLNIGSAFASDTNNTSGYAWSENIGWISFNSESDGSSVDYGVNIDPTTGYLSGYAWSENIGWISFNRGDSDTGAPPESDPCPTGGCIAKVDDPDNLGKEEKVSLVGWARVLSVKDNPDNSGNWDGWIKLNDKNGSWGVTIDENGDWHGWAWSDMVLGWISFNSQEGGGASYKVTTKLNPSPQTLLVNLTARPASGYVNSTTFTLTATITNDSVEGPYTYKFYKDDGDASPVCIFYNITDKNKTCRNVKYENVGQHIAKVVVTVPTKPGLKGEDSASIRVRSSAPPPSVPPSASPSIPPPSWKEIAPW
ncbi:MAG TPA: hypothetical protein ENL27_00525 [Candidatus Parcubacteria bacterium]|nr:hypothetical protein [Candidatus Parcubacteria bacterium]